MSWPIVVFILGVLYGIVALYALGVWFTYRQRLIEIGRDIQMRGPRPFWMQQPPQSLEEAAEMFRQMAEGQQQQGDAGEG